jgi:hypothetical protein
MPVALSAGQLTPMTVSTSGDIILPVPYCSQRPYQNLCWAACCEMILGYYQKPPQGGINQIASTVLKKNCADLVNCDDVHSPSDANLGMGIKCTPWNYPFTMEAILRELGAGRPIQTLLELNGAQHVILISGVSNGKLVVLDPWYGRALVDYGQLLDGYVNGGYWQFTYYNLTA